MKDAFVCKLDGQHGVLRNAPQVRVFQDMDLAPVVFHKGHVQPLRGCFRCLRVVFATADACGVAVSTFSRS